jgi:hypothetical protein
MNGTELELSIAAYSIGASALLAFWSSKEAVLASKFSIFIVDFDHTWVFL